MEFFFENISLGDGRYFEVDNGERVRKQDIQRAQGEIPFYSSSKFEGEVMGYVSNKIAPGEHILLSEGAVSISAKVVNKPFYKNGSAKF